MDRGCTGARLAGLAFAALAMCAATPGTAAAVGDDQTQAAQPREPDRQADFLFGPPRGSIAVRGTWLFASANSDLFDFVTDQLTLDKKDFNAPGLGAYFSLAMNSRLDVQAGYEFQKITKPSEYRDLVDNDFAAIEQTTLLKSSQIVGSLRYSLIPRGRDVSRFAYVPNRVVPYVGAGGGVLYYDFMQTGDFVDFADSRVFPDVFRSKGWTPTGHAFAGVDLQVYRALYAAIEGRYTKASATLGTDFVGFDPIDLSGFKLSAGINLLF